MCRIIYYNRVTICRNCRFFKLGIKISIMADFLENKVALSVLKDLKEKIEELHTKINEVESKIGKVQENALKNWFEQYQNIESKDIKQFYPDIELLHSKISELEKKFEERIPTKVLSETKFKEEVQDGNEIVDKIISELKNLMQKKPITQTIREPLTIVESKRIEKIISLLKRHEKLSSTELSDLIGLSRTRCNEYFKLMENLGMVKSILVGKEKYYGLKTN